MRYLVALCTFCLLFGCKKSTTGEKPKGPVERGKELVKVKGCTACHSLDGSKLVGPTFKGLFGKKQVVTTGGKERTITVDEAYIRRSIREPNADIVKGYTAGSMVVTAPVSDEEIEDIIAFLKTLK